MVRTALDEPTIARPAGPVMDPRIRRRRIEVRRDAGRRRLRVLLVFSALMVLSLAAWLAFQSPLLDVDHVRVEGADHTTTAQVVAAARVRTGMPMLKVDAGAAARRIDALPWVAQAAVRRQWPGTVTIRITERQAMAVISPGTGTTATPAAVLDGTGRVLEWATAVPSGLPVLQGLGAPPRPGATVPGARGSLEVLAAMTPQLLVRTAAVVATPTGDVDLTLNPRGTVYVGMPDDLPAKVVAIESVLAQVDTHDLLTLDVRLPSSPTLTRG